MDTTPLDSVPADFLKNLALVAVCFVSLAVNVYAVWKSKREISGTVRTQKIDQAATQNELRALEVKLDEVTARMLKAGERRAENLGDKIERMLEKFESRLNALRAELRAEFGAIDTNLSQRVNDHGEKIARLEVSLMPSRCVQNDFEIGG